MHVLQIKKEQADQFLDLVERHRNGEISRRSLRARLNLLSDGDQEPLWHSFLARFDAPDEPEKWDVD